MVKGGQECSFRNRSLLGEWLSAFAVGSEQQVVHPRVSLSWFASFSWYFFPAGEPPAQRHMGLLGPAHRAQRRESHGVSPPEKRTCGLDWSLVAQTPLYFLINLFWHKTLKTIFVQKYENGRVHRHVSYLYCNVRVFSVNIIYLYKCRWSPVIPWNTNTWTVLFFPLI